MRMILQFLLCTPNPYTHLGPIRYAVGRFLSSQPRRLGDFSSCDLSAFELPVDGIVAIIDRSE